ncbi:urokinase plasminogen activator surface receptor-like [Leptodactylus fuscus]|uniref:urokinase plasminogen activator surface receptor n=1 Tax=Leptodactylus fuscus TaxID=238119 RepID=UPI003F4E7E7D
MNVYGWVDLELAEQSIYRVVTEQSDRSSLQTVTSHPIMKLLLKSGLYSALLCLALGLHCYHFKGLPDHVSQEQEVKPCEVTQPYCSSSVVTYSNMLNGVVLTKGCSSAETCNQTQMGSLIFIETSNTKLCCDTDLCNQDLVPDLGEDFRTECLACHGTPSSCDGRNLPSLRCGPSQKSCIEVSITTALNQDTMHTMLKSCSNTSTCPGLSAFSNGKNPISYAVRHHCCNGSQCNAGRFMDEDPGAENGLECHSRSSPKESGRMKCRGQMTRCMDLTGSSADDVVMSGCATESFCQGLYPQFNIPGWKSTHCCDQSLCNHGGGGIKTGSHHD